MTGSTGPEDSASPEPEQPPPADPMGAATADLAGLQALLRRAAQGQASVGEVRDSVTGYWQEHGSALTTAAATLGEDARQRMLAELYEMRDRLNQQLGNRRQSPPQGGTPPEEHDKGG